MGQDSWSDTASPQTQHNRSADLLIGVGLLWFLLASALLVYQITKSAKIEINWETATEQRTAGYNIYRSTDPAEGYVLVNESQLIDAKGSPISGAHYSFIDDDVQAGKLYYYLLEEVELDSTRNRYEDELFEYTVPGASTWTVILIAGSALIGAVLLVAGLKEKIISNEIDRSNT